MLCFLHAFFHYSTIPSQFLLTMESFYHTHNTEDINSIIKLRYPDPVIIDIQGIFFTFVLLLLYTCGGFFFSFLSIYVFIWVGWLLVVCPGLSSYSLST